MPCSFLSVVFELFGGCFAQALDVSKMCRCSEEELRIDQQQYHAADDADGVGNTMAMVFSFCRASSNYFVKSKKICILSRVTFLFYLLINF